jgi:glutathione synthase/RimK-type ligase-like ATP-grasp enzyme
MWRSLARLNPASRKVPGTETLALDSAELVELTWPSAIRKPIVGVVKDAEPTYPHWPKYVRFLQYNGIPYDFYDVRAADWLDEASRFEVILWRSLSDPASQWEAKSKIHVIESRLHILCLPSDNELWYYEDKERESYLLRQARLPHITTFVSHDLADSLAFVRSAHYPLVSKIVTGASSLGVSRIESVHEAERLCRRAFSETGAHTYWPYLNQKDYVYFQEYVAGAEFDLRVMVAGDNAWGYYRRPTAGDFRASGSHVEEYVSLPEEALDLAVRVYDAVGCRSHLAVDMLRDPRDGCYRVVEFGTFCQVDRRDELSVDGVEGRYHHVADGWEFLPGKHWIQDFSVRNVLMAYLNQHSNTI